MITFQLMMPIRIGGGYGHKFSEKISCPHYDIHMVLRNARQLLRENKHAIEVHISGDRFTFSIDRHGHISYGDVDL